MAAKRLRDGAMPAAKRLRARAATVEARTTTTLPVDLLLEIVARSDAATIVRCAAAGKSIRRAILHPSFRRSRLAPANGGFDPNLLVAVSYKLSRLNDPPVLIIEDPQSSSVSPAVSGKFLHRIDEPPTSSYRPDADVLPIYKSYASEWKHSELVASRDVLVVVRKRPGGVRGMCTVPRQEKQQLCICNSLTGDTTRLPMADVVDEYPPAFLAVSDAGRSYELLVMDKNMRTQTFSSGDGKWGAIRAMEELPHPISAPLSAHRPLVVVGRHRRNAVYWLCPNRLGVGWGGVTNDLHILAVDVGAGRRASRIELPPDCLSRMKPIGSQSDGILLAPSPSPDGELSLIVAEILVISQWTLLSSSSSSSEGSPERWSRQVVISRLAIDRQAGHDVLMGFICFHGLGLMSGAVLLQIRMLDAGFIAVLNLASKQCLILRRWDNNNKPSELCLQEIDLASLLQSMRRF
uniref:DUF7595 domain-containing protein n=1 Tax=Oryza punctata TaxID=4537 RepID=A0A0E0KJM4_ORYPU